ncbi:MAG: tetratricopeptide repeat protein, partial [Persicimonas sp.]
TTDEEASDEAGKDGEAGDEQPHPVIRRHGQTSDSAGAGEAEGDSKGDAGGDEPQPEDPVELAQKAFEAQNHEQAVKYLEQVPIDQLDADAMSLYGRALMALDEHHRAQRWLAGAVEEEPSPDNVEALLQVYVELKSDEKIAKLCKRFAGESELEDILARCPHNRMRRELEDQ